MAVMYRLRKSTNENNTSYNKWYAHPVINGTMETEDLAEIMQRNCTVKRSDILAVLTELAEVMTEALQNSNRVRLNGIGTFKMSMSSEGVENVEDFNATKIKKLRVLFHPETHIEKDGSRWQVLIKGANVMETPKNAVGVETEATGATGGEEAAGGTPGVNPGE